MINPEKKSYMELALLLLICFSVLFVLGIVINMPIMYLSGAIGGVLCIGWLGELSENN